MTEKRRRSIRLPGYDYARAGAYFVTICTHQRTSIFGAVENGEMQLNPLGEIVREIWFQTPQVRPYVVLYENEFVVMPNHIHGIIWITDPDGPARSVGATRRVAPTERPHGPAPDSLGAIIGQIKSIITKRINALRNTPGAPVWQRNYWEHIIRTEVALSAIRQYILDNAQRWELDRYNARAVGPDPVARNIWMLLQEQGTTRR